MMISLSFLAHSQGSEAVLRKYHRVPGWNGPQGSTGPTFLGKSMV